MSFRKMLYLLILSALTSATMQAQKGYEVGVWAGTSFYFGDLNTTNSVKKLGLAGGLRAKYNFDTRISFYTDLSIARISAADSLSDNYFEKNRNLSFRSNIIDLTAGFEINFMEYYHGSKNAWYTPYVLLGFSVFHYNPKAKLGDTWYTLRDLGTEGQASGNEYGSIGTGLVLGGGFKFDLNQDWSVNLFYSNHRTFVDYIDDVSKVFPDPNALLAARGQTAVDLSNRALIDGIGEAGRQRGNSRSKDVYAFVGVSIMRYFGGIECPKVSEIKF